MGARERQIGGGAATGVANDFNSFLREQLQGPRTAMPRNPYNMGGGFETGNGMIDGNNTMMQNNAQQPQMQGGSSFRDAFGNAMSGQVRDISGAGGALNNFFQNPNAMNLPTNFGNQFSAPNAINPQFSQLPTNFGQGQTGMADLSGFGQTATSNFNSQQNLGGVNSGFTGTLNDLISRGSNNMNMGGGFSAASAGQDISMQPGMDFRQAYDTLGQDPLMERNRMRAIADQRARFGAEGAGGLGTGAQFAESNLNAELTAQDASRRRAEAMQLMGQDLNNRSAMSNVGLQNRGQNVQTAIANMQGGLQGNQNQIGALNALTNAAVAGRGQDFSTGLGMRGQNLQQLGMGMEQDMFNAGQTNNVNMNMLGATLQNQGMGNNFGLGAAGLNNAAMQNNNMNSFNNANMLNNFNQNNAQFGAQFGQAANQLNSQNQGMNNNMFTNMVGQGMGMNQLGNQNTMGMLGQMFGGFGQANQLGTPQAQMIQQPNPWGQALNAGLTIGGALLGGPGGAAIGGALGGMFGRGGQSASLPVGIGGSALPRSMGNFNLGAMPNFNIGSFGGGSPAFSLPNTQLPTSLFGGSGMSPMSQWRTL
jgi:hypothetical protein